MKKTLVFLISILLINVAFADPASTTTTSNQKPAKIQSTGGFSSNLGPALTVVTAIGISTVVIAAAVGISKSINKNDKKNNIATTGTIAP